MMKLINTKNRDEAPSIEDYQKKPTRSNRIEFGLRTRNEFQNKSSPDRPLVSIITIVRNGEKTIEKTIQSVLAQTYNNIEYVIIDGASTDRTLDILRKYQERIAYCMSESDRGIGDAFNKGISVSTGDLVGIINSDDWYCENAVESIVLNFQKYGEKIFHGNNQRWNEKMQPEYVFTANDEKILNRMTINHPTVFVPKRIYEEVGLFRLDFEVAMDYEWLRRARLFGKEFYYINQIIANMSSGGVSDAKWLKGYIENAKARRLHGVNPVSCYLVLAVMLLVTFSRKGFEKIGLNSVVEFYKKHFSMVKKYKTLN
jgi:glycosyltransferase involved in cell wall biosynthesis